MPSSCTMSRRTTPPRACRHAASRPQAHTPSRGAWPSASPPDTLMSNAEIILAAVFWCSLGGVVYVYAGYPLLLFAASRVLGRRPAPPPVRSATPPRIALVIAAHNEEGVIGERLGNALELAY